MTHTADAPSRTGWFGKLPGSGDFAQRRLDTHFTHTWDGWLQDGMAELRQRHADWLSHYLQAPVWQFMLGQGLVAERAWLGVMMPSVDAVGRYFPLTVVTPVEMGLSPQWAAWWWQRVGHSLLAALDHEDDVVRFDARLTQALTERPAADGVWPDMPAAPAPDESVWWPMAHDAAPRTLRVPGLPGAARFVDMFMSPDWLPVKA